MAGLFQTARSFGATLWHARRGLSRHRFEARQSKALQKWLCRDLPKVKYYEQAPATLKDLPIIDKAELMASFEDFNTRGITVDQIREAMRDDFRIYDLTVGASTGTSGNRGLFVISDPERYRWLGAILAKALPDMIFKKQRIAILLPQNGPLYDSARTVSRISLRFFSLAEGPEQWRDALEAFDPTVIIAPPKILRYMIETGFETSPKRVFSAAETLDPVDRPIIENGFGLTLDQIYMATEGLLGVTCRFGRLHLAEESIFFEFEDVGEGLASPLITSFARTTQIMARYRMNDLLRLSKTPCPCGSPLQAVDEVIGRMDDCFHFKTTMITPDILRNAILNASPEITDFRLTQHSEERVVLRLQNGVDIDVGQQAKTALEAVFQARGVDVILDISRADLPLDTQRKLRRVERLKPDEAVT